MNLWTLVDVDAFISRMIAGFSPSECEGLIYSMFLNMDIHVFLKIKFRKKGKILACCRTWGLAIRYVDKAVNHVQFHHKYPPWGWINMYKPSTI